MEIDVRRLYVFDDLLVSNCFDKHPNITTALDL